MYSANGEHPIKLDNTVPSNNSIINIFGDYKLNKINWIIKGVTTIGDECSQVGWIWIPLKMHNYLSIDRRRVSLL